MPFSLLGMRPAPVRTSPVSSRCSLTSTGGLDQSELRQCSDPVIESELLHDLAIEHLQHRGAGEVHLAALRGRKTADQKIVEGAPRVRTSTFPLAHDVVAFGDELGCAPGIEVRKG